MVNKLTIKYANTNDCIDVFNWRNDVESRRMFLISRRVTWDEHKKWFENSLLNPMKVLLICYDAYKDKVGIVRFDIESTQTLISINLNPLKRGQRLSSQCLKESIKFFISNYNLKGRIVAIVKENNVRSLKSFISSNFILLEKKNKKIFLEYSKNLARKRN